MSTYGYTTRKTTYWVAEFRDADNCSRCDTFIGHNRAAAIRAFLGMAKGEKLAKVWEIDESDMDEMERWGFRPETTRPSKINWSSLDLY